jgi:Activator of Hsp90 ATPase homolog 1-like protein
VWIVEFGPSPRELYRHRHVFEVIERPYRLVLASTETRLDGLSFHTQLEFPFEARDGKTLMTMTQRGFPSAELREEHERGVPNAFARLDRLIQLSRTPTDVRHDSAP